MNKNFNYIKPIDSIQENIKYIEPVRHETIIYIPDIKDKEQLKIYNCEYLQAETKQKQVIKNKAPRITQMIIPTMSLKI